ncbi:MAG: HNH endonuclease family protein [Bacteroidia bacterium]
MHTIGNLTILTGSLNPSVSNSSFDVKKQEIGLQSTVILNSYFQDKTLWDEEEIKKRSKFLYEQIKKIWIS